MCDSDKRAFLASLADTMEPTVDAHDPKVEGFSSPFFLSFPFSGRPLRGGFFMEVLADGRPGMKDIFHNALRIGRGSLLEMNELGRKKGIR